MPFFPRIIFFDFIGLGVLVWSTNFTKSQRNSLSRSLRRSIVGLPSVSHIFQLYRARSVGMAHSFRSVVVFTPEKTTKTTPVTVVQKPKSPVRRHMPNRTVKPTYPRKGITEQRTIKKDNRGLWVITEIVSNNTGGVYFECSLSGVKLTGGIEFGDLDSHDKASFSCGTKARGRRYA